jgi:hypothetical protein
MPFNELIAAEEISLNFIFRGDELPVKEDDLSLSNTELCNRIGITSDLLQPLSLQETSAYHTRQVARNTQAPRAITFASCAPCSVSGRSPKALWPDERFNFRNGCVRISIVAYAPLQCSNNAPNFAFGAQAATCQRTPGYRPP